MSVFLIFIVVIVLIGLFVMKKYNGIIVRKNKRDQSFSDIDVQLKQRFDLIPQLLETVKGYMKHEKDVLENVTKARTGFMNAQNIEDKIAADNMLTGALKTLFAVSEGYPDLKASTNFTQFQLEITNVENKLATVRSYFNETTTNFNTYIEMFPTNIIAGIFSYKRLPLFETAESRKELEEKPEIKF
jgi:LemA protein